MEGDRIKNIIKEIEEMSLKAAAEEVQKMTGEDLVKSFEYLIQRGAGEQYYLREWMRKEILLRI